MMNYFHLIENITILSALFRTFTQASENPLNMDKNKGFFTIDENYKIVIHPDVLRTDSYINMYNGHELHLPQVDYFKPNQNYLQYHRDTIYGTFRQIRRLSDLVSGYQ